MTVGWGDDVAAQAADKLRDEIAADRLHTRGVGSLPSTWRGRGRR